MFDPVMLIMISSTGILTIDLSAIQSNWKFVSTILRDGAECAAVVKANAYGVGVKEVALALYGVGCRSFFVVTLHEAVELRAILASDSALYVLGGVPSGMEEKFVELNLIPVVYSLDALKQWIAFCRKKTAALPCALKFNTGMTRLGLDEVDYVQFELEDSNNSFLNPVLLMSHLACADEHSHPLNDVQLNRFLSIAEKLKHEFPKIKLSLANSSGTFLGEKYHFDMVRIGAALYGINPQMTNPNPLKQVFSLRLPVLQIRSTKQKESVGYGATTSVEKNARLAVVAGGYADGTHRSLGFSPAGLVGGQRVRAVGRMSMDSFIFDISDVSGDPEYIDVINEQLTLDVLMQANKTIGYEVLTSLGDRYQRRYIFSEVADE